MKLLEGKVALVTGANRGIGRAIALGMAKQGAHIAFTDLVIDDNTKSLETELASLGVKGRGYASNDASYAETEEVVKQIIVDFETVDILVNNAGITKDTLLMRMTASPRTCKSSLSAAKFKSIPAIRDR